MPEEPARPLAAGNGHTVIVVGLLLVVAFGVYLALRSPFLDDFDSVNFALALTDFDVARHQPHPPGFPLYVLLGRLFLLVFPDPQLSLSLLSVSAGALSVASLYLVARPCCGSRAAILGAALLLVFPVHLRAATMALSDVVVLPFLNAAVLLFSPWREASLERRWRPLLGSAVLGVAAGVRPQILPLSLTLGVLLVSRLPLRAALRAALAFGAGVLAWLLPFHLGGHLRPALSAGARHLDAQRSELLFPSWSRLQEGWTLLADGVRFPLALIAVALAFAVASVLRRPREGETGDRLVPGLAFGVFWLLGSVLATVAGTPLHRFRYWAPVIPPLAFVFALGLAQMLRRARSKAARGAVLALAAASLVPPMLHSLRIGTLLRTVPPASVQAARFIARRTAAAGAIVFSDASFRHWQYSLPQLQHVQLPLAERQLRLASWGPPRAIVSESRLPGTPPDEVVTFERPLVVENRHHRASVHLYSLGSPHLLFFSPHRERGDASTLSSPARGLLSSSTEEPLLLSLGVTAAPGAARVELGGSTLWQGSVGVEGRHLEFVVRRDPGLYPFSIELDGASAGGEPGLPLSVACVKLTPVPVVRLGEELGTTALDREGLPLLRCGWSWPEDWATWSDGSRASIYAVLSDRPRTPVRVTLQGRFLRPDPRRPVDVALSCNGSGTMRFTVDRHNFKNGVSFDVPPESIGPDGALAITIAFDGLQSPAERAWSEDPRRVGFALRSIAFEPVPGGSTRGAP